MHLLSTQGQPCSIKDESLLVEAWHERHVRPNKEVSPAQARLTVPAYAESSFLGIQSQNSPASARTEIGHSANMSTAALCRACTE